MAWIWVLAAAINGVLAVTAGAAASHFFAHDPRDFAWLTTGAQYAMFHALALLALAALTGRSGRAGERFLAAAGWLFIAGTVLFSGSLYVLALTGPGILLWLTPLGGIAFMLGWAAIGVYAWVAWRRGQAAP
jgi:uncharacterized membrane protein YgdD (TMEM256/DUF423 family)